jgi:hypothetical protein
MISIVIPPAVARSLPQFACWAGAWSHGLGCPRNSWHDYALMTMAREVVKDTEIGGCPFREGTNGGSCRSRLATAIHRRIGSNLAPVEIAVALELVAIPGSISTVRRDDMVAGMVRGPRRLPILFRRETAHLSQPSEKLDGWAQRTVQTHRGN